MKKRIAILLMGLIMTLINSQSGYKLPPENIVKIFDAPEIPSVYFIPFTKFGFEKEIQKRLDWWKKLKEEQEKSDK